ncbi:MtrAB system histidine kinase MtrB [Cellulomonas oligotrophica]|uniref:Sensor histidine kinase MtrB n=1 Tax=Cellulomonas oligotrophica TaxID=931536 RepID=A0A7Y9FD62_9CELL|nr:MtrAB system histidine kinase MtrB [Cellulomonas oligotrophica]NYD85193.1 two-component system sensor histidine kinase MtrB [Cellulomonas oligotrophica]GIG34168.1 two-component sensor histidine kinase [Cellulomonas oligotrophica]
MTRTAGSRARTDAVRALALRWRLLRVRATRRARSASRHWRSSLQVRVLTSTLVIGLVALALLGLYVGDRVRDGLFDARRDQVLVESARSTQQAQGLLDAATATTGRQVQTLLQDVTDQVYASGSGERDVFMLRAPGQTSTVGAIATASDRALVDLVSRELKEATAGGGQHWQSVGVVQDDGRVSPAVVVGQDVTVPVVGTYQIFFLYSLQAEQDRLDFLLRTLALAGAALVVLLGATTWSVTRRTVHPVRRAAQVAERLADGHLSERMPVRGEDEMATLARSFNEMAESLQDQIRRMEELSTLQRRFVSDVSHELRTPLTTIRMAGEVIHASREDFEPAVKRSAELLQTQLDRFEDLLADLLEISRFDAGAAVLDAEGRDVRDVVLRAVDNAAPLAQRRGSWVHVDLPATPATADIDPRRVERVLRNLLVNAVEHADGSAVEVTVGADQHAVAVTVRDHGVGMTAQEAAHVFDRFWRADPARARTTGGTGLGLAISLEDAHLHGGWLQAWGRPGRGASFRLTLPRRAGIELTGSPLPLEPDERPVSPAEPVRPVHDPAALPELPPMTGEITVVGGGPGGTGGPAHAPRAQAER